MIPGGAVLCGKKVVNLATSSRRDGAFRNSVGAVLEVGSELANSVPVNGSPLLEVSYTLGFITMVQNSAHPFVFKLLITVILIRSPQSATIVGPFQS